MSDLVGNSEVPIGTPQPGVIGSPEGAIAAYNGAIGKLASVYGGKGSAGSSLPYIAASGLLADELTVLSSAGVGGLVLDGTTAIDTRSLMEYRTVPQNNETSVYWNLFSSLYVARSLSSEAIGSLKKYAPGAPKALTGHMYAVQAYIDLMLADFYCSGIPLTTLVFEGDAIRRPGSSVNEVYEHAIALFDTALSLATDSTRIMNLARIGKGRALLALGRYAEAATAVSDVPSDYVYAARYSKDYFTNFVNIFYSVPTSTGHSGLPYNMSVSDREGTNGLDFVSARDPRVPVDSVEQPNVSIIRFFPARFSVDGATSIPMATGIEARLIEAEADLANDNSAWLNKLNTLRTSGTFSTAVNPNDPAKIDTTWNAGTGGVANLRPLQDPGNKTGQVALLFRERGFWLYLTGHRQGDLRRLVRVYKWNSRSVYPTGTYHGPLAVYGDDINAPIPARELETNSLLKGCLNRHD